MKQRRSTLELQSGSRAPVRPAAKTKARSRHVAEPAGAAGPRPLLDAGERNLLIAMAAYFRAEKRGFASGGEVDDWLEAEKEIARLLSR